MYRLNDIQNKYYNFQPPIKDTSPYFKDSPSLDRHVLRSETHHPPLNTNQKLM